MILGVRSVEYLSELNFTLRELALRYARSRFNIHFPRYIPWMCLLPKLNYTVLPADYLAVMKEEYKPGELLINESQLRTISIFLQGSGRMLAEHLEAPSKIAIFDNIVHANPMASILFRDARDLLLLANDLFADLLFPLVDTVVPLRIITGELSLSTHYSRGAIFLTLPEEEPARLILAIDLAHELGHQALMIFQSGDPLVAHSTGAVYSGIREKLRPAVQSMHAAAALAYMLLCVRGLLASTACYSRENAYLRERNAVFRDDLEKTITDLMQKCTFTPIGGRVMRDLISLL